MKKNAEEKVTEFYNNVGWKTEGEVTEDAARWEDLRECAGAYVSKCRLRVLRHIPAVGEFILDMASGPIQYREYLEYSRGYEKRYCIDLSLKALDLAKKKIGDHGVFLNGSFFDIVLNENYFDCSISIHTIYHIDKEKREEAVRKLIAVTKPGKPVIIVYSNPRTIFKIIALPIIFLKNIFELLTRRPVREDEHALYYFAHPVGWWDRFRDVADVQIFPWRSFTSDIQKALIPDNKLGKKVFDILFRLEERYPDFFCHAFSVSDDIAHEKELTEI